MEAARPTFELAAAPIPAHLARYIDSWIGYREASPFPLERREYPTGRAVLIFEFGEPIELRSGAGFQRFSTGFFAGIDETPTLTRFSGEQAGIEVNLSPEGAFAFSRGAVAELHGLALETVELGLPRSFCAELRELGSWQARFQRTAEMLERCFAAARPHHSAVREAIRLLDAEPGSLGIGQLSQKLGVSRTYLHERFRAETGFAPKRYAALRRFARVKTILRSGDYGSLADVAQRTGFADQAHMARSVREFAGMTARELAHDLNAPIALAIERLVSEGDASSLARA